jgi:hypothetical protein
MISARDFTTGLILVAFGAGGACAADLDSDYTFYKTRVEPIFLKKRPTHARCATCHAGPGGGALGLSHLQPGSTWTEEESRRNYEIVSQLVAPGNPTSSQLLMRPLAPSAGGDIWHGGGQQFASQDDPDWQTMAEWVRQKPKYEFKNLKVLKPDDRLFDTMRFFNLSFRASCWFCHAIGDFASDKNPMKVAARSMIQMTETLNQNLGNNKVTCYTCHRGDLRPKTLHPRFPTLVPE